MVQLPRPAEAGYTLLELLIATILGAFLIAAITEALRFTGHVDAGLHRSETDFEDVTAAEHVVSQTIEEARPVFVEGGYAARIIAFGGASDRLQLMSRLPQGVAFDQVADETLSVEGTGSVRHLCLSWSLDLPSSEPAGVLPAKQVQLLDHVQAVRFRYFGQDDALHAAHWHESWTKRSHLPTLVKVEIDRDTGVQTSSLELFVRPEVSMTPDCRFNPEDRACRRVQ